MLETKGLILCVSIVLWSSFQSLMANHAGTDRGIIFVTPNLDDDDGDGKPDAEDEIVNGSRDWEDLTAIQVPQSVLGGRPVFTGTGAELYRVVEIKASDSTKATVYIEAKGPRSDRSAATLNFQEDSAPRISFEINVKPFILTSSVDPAREIFIVRIPESESAIEGLESILATIPKAPALTVLGVEKGSDIDVWIQDATEIGVFPNTTISAAFAGLRGKHNNPKMQAEKLDQHFVDIFRGSDRCVLSIGEPLPKRRWIDWFGNLESTPPFADTDGKTFPWGRILVGRQRELGMHDAIMQFLKFQNLQWPPIVLDTSFLLIGHVDEIVNFVPTKTGFKVILASPQLGYELLERLAQNGHKDEVLLAEKAYFRGKFHAETTVGATLQNTKVLTANKNAVEIMAANRERLKRAMNLTDTDIIDLPVVMTPQGWTLWPNPVNGLVLDTHYIAPRPFGPMVGGRDMVEEAIRAQFARTEIKVHFLDVFDAYSSELGETHCGTNAIRHRTQP